MANKPRLRPYTNTVGGTAHHFKEPRCIMFAFVHECVGVADFVGRQWPPFVNHAQMVVGGGIDDPVFLYVVLAIGFCQDRRNRAFIFVINVAIFNSHSAVGESAIGREISGAGVLKQAHIL